MADATFRRRWLVAEILARRTGGLRAPEIHARLEECCSLRTVYRDLRALQEVGLPLQVDANGRWRLLGQGGVFCGLRCSVGEVRALRLAEEALATCWSGSRVFRTLQGIRRRAEASAVPPRGGSERRGVGRASPPSGSWEPARHLARPARPTGPVPPGTWDIVEEALAERRCLRLCVDGLDGTWTEERLHPGALVARGEAVFVFGWCDAVAGPRAIPLARVRRAVIEGPADPGRLLLLDADGFWSRLFGVEDGPSWRATLRLSGAAAREVRERPLHPRQCARRMDEGHLLVTLEIAGLRELARWVAGHGGEAVPLAPPELIDMVREIHRRGLAALTVDDDDT